MAIGVDRMHELEVHACELHGGALNALSSIHGDSRSLLQYSYLNLMRPSRETRPHRSTHSTKEETLTMAPLAAAASSLLKPSYRVAIVGAGVAGLTAARELLESKRLRANELVVLEASDRIGGRVRSTSFGSQKPVKIEAGAAWIHGASPANAFFRDVIEPAKIEYKVISQRNPWLYPASCEGFELYAEGHKLSDADVQHTWRLSEELLKTLQRYATVEALVTQHRHQSVQEIVEMLVANGSETNADNAELKRLVEGHPRGKELIGFCLVLVECWMGATSDSLQLEDFEEIDLIGDDPGAHCLVTYGMEQTVTHLASSIDQGVTHTDTPVDLVEYSPTDGVTLHVCGGQRTVHADHVIVTCSLGALKAEKIKFTPPLPEAKRAAIQRSSMGQYMKVLLEFPEVFWPETAQFFGQIPSRTPNVDERVSFPLVFNYFSVKGAPLLEAVVFGNAALESSELQDSEIIGAYLRHLQRLFGRDIPAPVAHFITRWDKDPWAVGAYSYLTLESSLDDPELLRETVQGRVLFGGEATNMQYQGSLQAAYLSGLAAVEEWKTLTACPKSHETQQQMTTQERLRRGEIPCRGVNVGGWLVAEHWMTWDSPIWHDIPEDVSSKGEFATMQFLGHDKGDVRFEEHRSMWITEADIAEMKRFGLNTVRVPVGFWAMGEDPTDASGKQEWKVFAPNALRFVDQLVNEWCLKHDLAVLIDIHAAKGSQNGRDHSAPPDCGMKYWSEYPENVENTVLFAKFLAERYRSSPAFLGVGLLNEPEYPVNPQTVRDYYTQTYDAIRSSGNDCVLVTAPMLTEQHPPVMDDLLRPPAYTNVWHEWHPYFIWGYEGQSAEQVLQAVRGYAESVKKWRGNWLLMSEWSLGAQASAFPAEDRQKLKQFADAQLNALSNAHAGWTFWSWKHSDDQHGRPTGWSLRQLLRDGVMKISP